MSIPSDRAGALPEALEDRLAGTLLGLALGDATGFVVESEPPDVAAEYVRDWLLAGRAGERAHRDYPFGQYSDDTQLARVLLLGVRDAGAWSPPAFALRLAELFGAEQEVGAGEGTRGAARRILAGAGWEHAGTPPPYAGNGSAMRVAPLGVLFGSDLAALRRAAVEQSLVTHRDSRCGGAAVAVAGAAALAARPGPLRRAGFLEELAGLVAGESEEVAEVVGGLEAWADLPPDAAARHVHAIGLDAPPTHTWRGIPAHVVPSVAWSLYAFLRSPDDYWSVVCTAIAVGGDTDTMAAMAGGIAGARGGVGALPRGLLDRLTDRGEWGAPELEQLARACARLARSGS